MKQQRERGFWLSLWLVLIMIHSIFATFIIFALRSGPDTPETPWLLGILLIASAAGFVGAIGIWNWEKWGLYTYIISVLITMVVIFFLIGIFFLLYPVVLLAILGWLIRDKWGYFGIKS